MSFLRIIAKFLIECNVAGEVLAEVPQEVNRKVNKDTLKTKLVVDGNIRDHES